MEVTIKYNLLEEKWIPVLFKDGKTRPVGVIEALEHASTIRCITLASPLDLFAVHRFLLTLLYWKANSAGGVEQVRDSLLKNKELLGAVINAIKNEAPCFNLFDQKSPFLQDASFRDNDNKKRKSVGSLFAELASGTNIAHFQHGDDEDMRLCQPCVTLGMLRAVPWTQVGGQGLSSSIHGAPPIMAVASGDNLAVTLGLNLVPLEGEAGQASWTGQFKPTDKAKRIPYLEALTWNPRRILLPQPQNGICWYCGQGDVLTVGKIVYEKNENTKTVKEVLPQKESKKSIPFNWKDPSAFYPCSKITVTEQPTRRVRAGKSMRQGEENKTVKSYDECQALDNRDLQPLSNAESIIAEKNVDFQGWLLVVPCTNPKNNKTFDHRQVEIASIKDMEPPKVRSSENAGLDGWDQPSLRPSNGVKCFVKAAARLLTYVDWAVLSNAAFLEMHESPAAFDLMSGLYWGLRNRKIKGLPSKNVAWLTLKLMASTPSYMRVVESEAKFSPINSLTKRQIKGHEKKRKSLSIYPVAFPKGRRLEADIRCALDGNARKRSHETVDWVGLCEGLNRLLD